MATIPAVPTFTSNSTPSISVLNELAACAAFVSALPAFCELSGSQSLASGNAALTWTTKVTDRDGGWSSGSDTRYTAQTPGYYDLAAQVTFATNATGLRQAYFQVTTGSGNITQFGAQSVEPAGGVPTRLAIGIMSPYLYAGDYIQVWGEQTSGSGLSTATSYWQIALESLGP
jgi:hypothetical protein